MVLVHSTALDETVKIDRVIDHIRGKKGGPTLVFFGGEDVGVAPIKLTTD